MPLITCVYRLCFPCNGFFLPLPRVHQHPTACVPKPINPTYAQIHLDTAMRSSSFSRISLIAVLVFLFAGIRRVDATSVVVDDANTARITYSTGWKDFNDLVKPTKEGAYNETF